MDYNLFESTGRKFSTIKALRQFDQARKTRNQLLINPTRYNHFCFQVPEGFSDLMVKREVGKVFAKSDAAPATVYM